VLSVRGRAARALAPRSTVRSRGLRFTLQCDNAITHYRWRTFNDKEPETLDWIDAWVRDGDTLFDVGANIGVYTVYAALRHPRARIVAFEPEYANLHLLRDNVVLNGLQDRVEIYGLALGRRVGLSRLHLSDLTPGAALHTEATDALDATRTGRPVVGHEGICTWTLDAFCAETGLAPDAIKIDVDGTEPELLEGAERTLASPRLRSVTIELPEEPAAYAAAEARLVKAGLRRHWRDAAGRTQNETWNHPEGETRR